MAQIGETITLLADVTLADSTAIRIHEKANITLDLNGYTLSGKNKKLQKATHKEVKRAKPH